jgi:hypothetical protein
MSASNTGISKRGIDVLHDPRINKSTGFTAAERQALGLVGLVPDVTESIETQLDRVLAQLKDKPTDLERFIHLMNLLETNQNALLSHLDVGPGPLPRDRVRPDDRRSLPELVLGQRHSESRPKDHDNNVGAARQRRALIL